MTMDEFLADAQKVKATFPQSTTAEVVNAVAMFHTLRRQEDADAMTGEWAKTQRAIMQRQEGMA